MYLQICLYAFQQVQYNLFILLELLQFIDHKLKSCVILYCLLDQGSIFPLVVLVIVFLQEKL